MLPAASPTAIHPEKVRFESGNVPKGKVPSVKPVPAPPRIVPVPGSESAAPTIPVLVTHPPGRLAGVASFVPVAERELGRTPVWALPPLGLPMCHTPTKPLAPVNTRVPLDLADAPE